MTVFVWKGVHAHNSQTLEWNGSYLEWVDVKSSHWPCVPVTLSNDHVILSSHDLCWIIQDDVAVLASCNKDPRWVTVGIHSIRTPDQLVVSAGRMCVMNSCAQEKKSTAWVQSAVFSTCGRRRSSHMTSCPDMVLWSLARKTPGRHWCWRRHPAAGLMFLQKEWTGTFNTHWVTL